MGDSIINNNETKETGLAALDAELERVYGETDAQEENVEVEATSEKVVENEDTEVEAKEEVKEEEVEEEVVAATEEKEEEKVVDGDSEAKKEEVYEPNMEYKFQDEIFTFDDRVKAAIKSKEDEEYFRDLYTKQAAMELMQERAETLKNDYSALEVEAKKNDTTINYWSSLLEGVSRGDKKSFSELMTLCNVNHDVLENHLAPVMVEMLENKQQYDNNLYQTQVQHQTQAAKAQQESIQAERDSLALTHTELAVQKSLQDPTISEIAAYVDQTLGEGSFEQAVWKAGSEAQANNPKLSVNDIPAIVKSVADTYGKFRPVTNTQNVNKNETKVATHTRVVKNNTTNTLPNVKGANGTPVEKAYKDGTGLDGLAANYKKITGNELI